MPFSLSDLPYPKNALEPHISAETLEFHHGKHHNTYIVNLNKLIEGSDFDNMSLDKILRSTAGDEGSIGIFNNAAQCWNHSFYWHSMKPNGGGSPKGELLKKIDQAFGSFDEFKEKFKVAGLTLFGSGWVWLVLNEDGTLELVKTSNADNPIVYGQKPLLTMDVWEHAYYIDFRNARAKYIDIFLDHLVNWDFAAENLGS